MATTGKNTVSGFWLGVRGEIGRRRGSPVVKRGNLEPPPLSFQQERLWLAERLSPGGAAHNISMHHRLTGPLDPSSLRRAIQEIVSRHEILRTSLRLTGTEARQHIAAALEVDLALTDLSGFPEFERDMELKRLSALTTGTPFDLGTPPLWRFHLLRLHAEEHVLLRAFHHFIFDHWSGAMFQRELAALYTAFTNGEESPLRPLALQYADYTLWQRQVADASDYWHKVFAGRIERLELPLGPTPEITGGSGAGGDLSVALPEELAGALSRLSEECGVSLFVTLLAGLKALLHARSGQKDLTVCTPVSGRSRHELRHLIGYFNNIVPLRSRISGNFTVRTWLGRVGQIVLDSQAHQDVPFQKIAAIPAAERRELEAHPFFDAKHPGAPAGNGRGENGTTGHGTIEPGF